MLKSMLKEYICPVARRLKGIFFLELYAYPPLKLELQHFSPEATLRTYPAANLLQNDQVVLSGASFHHGFESLPKLCFLGSRLLKKRGARILKNKSSGAVVLKSIAYMILQL